MSALRRRTVRCLAVIALVGVPSGSSAQRAGSADCGYEAGSIVQGTVVNDSTGAPVQAQLHIDLPRGHCFATTDALGRFTLHHIPPGTHRVGTTVAGYRPFIPVAVPVTLGDTAYVELRLTPGGRLEDCRAEVSCSVLLERGSVSADSADADFRLVALGTAIGLAWQTVAKDGRWYACLKDELKAHEEALRDRYGPVAEAESCEIRADPSWMYGPRMLHIDTMRPAFQPIIEDILILSPMRRTVTLGYFYAPHGGEGWECDFVQTEQGWRATVCIESWIS